MQTDTQDGCKQIRAVVHAEWNNLTFHVRANRFCGLEIHKEWVLFCSFGLPCGVGFSVQKKIETRGWQWCNNVKVYVDKILEAFMPGKSKDIYLASLHGTLPCRSILANNHIKVVEHFSVRDLAAEDAKGTSCEYQKAKDIWKTLGLDDLIEQALSHDHAREVALEYLLRLENSDCAVLGG